MTEEEKQYIIGAQGCIWTEWTRDSLKMEWQILPRMAALSEIQWTEPAHKDFDGFLNRLPALLAIYKDRGYDFRQVFMMLPSRLFPKNKKEKLKSFSYFRYAEVHYTLDGSEPNAQSSLYTDTLHLDKDAVIQAIAVRPQGNSSYQ